MKNQINLENFTKAIFNKRSYGTRPCSLCGCKVGYFVKNYTSVELDTNCDCVSYYSEPQMFKIQDLFNYEIKYNEKYLTQFIQENLNNQ